jgi:hypothetical protein
MRLEAGELKLAYKSSKAQQVVFIEGESVLRLPPRNVDAQSDRAERDEKAADVHNQQLPAMVGRGEGSIGSRERLVGGAHGSDSSWEVVVIAEVHARIAEW